MEITNIKKIDKMNVLISLDLSSLNEDDMVKGKYISINNMEGRKANIL